MGTKIPSLLSRSRIRIPGCISCPPKSLRVKSDVVFPSHLQPTATLHPSPTVCPLQLGPQPRHHPLNCGEAQGQRTYQSTSAVTMPPAGKNYIPPNRPSSPGFLNSDFFQQQVAKQRNNNYHSTSLRNMVASSVNRTALHPGGVQYVLSL